MERSDPIAAFAALANPDRIAIVQLLARRVPGSMCPAEIIAATGLKGNTLSNHLATLGRAELVDSRREGRNVFYTLRMDRIGALVDHLVGDCCGGRPDACAPLTARHLVSFTKVATMGDTPPNVLFICTGNSARSIMAEALLRELGQGRFRAFSAGTNPAGKPNPHALATLARHGHATGGLYSKDISAFDGDNTPQMSFVFTVCDRAAAEPCPVWFGPAMTAHWGLPDPANDSGSPEQVAAAFERAYQTLRLRIEEFIALPLGVLERPTVQQELDRIATLEPSAEAAPSSI